MSIPKSTSALLLALLLHACAEGTGPFADAPATPVPMAATAGPPPAPATPEGALHLELRAEHGLVRPGSQQPVHLLLTVRAVVDDQPRERLPLNLAVVIDRSGSMEGEKLAHAKQACITLVDNLGPQDKLSLVVYDSDVRVLRRSDEGPVDKEAVKRLVRSLHAGSATNLSGGMLQGYAEAARFKDSRYVHRVLLMSDGLANNGITEPERLQAIVRTRFQEDGIALSAFGIGADFNEDLMTALAENGRGNYWFIDQADRMPGIFQQELDGLLSVVAQNTRLSLQLPPGLAVEQVYGAEHTVQGDALVFAMNDLRSGEERQVVLVLKPRAPLQQAIPFTAQLVHDDARTGRSGVEQRSEVVVGISSDEQALAMAVEQEVTRRLVQYRANHTLEQAMRAADRGDHEAAEQLVLSNAVYLSEQFEEVAPDSAQQELLRINQQYGAQIKDMDRLSGTEKKMVQKWSKSEAYRNRKGK
jgi:Ca-activated chloride channel homolog